MLRHVETSSALLRGAPAPCAAGGAGPPMRRLSVQARLEKQQQQNAEAAHKFSQAKKKLEQKIERLTKLLQEVCLTAHASSRERYADAT